MRDYGLEPQIWDAKTDCEHEWGEEQTEVLATGGMTEKQVTNRGQTGEGFSASSSSCVKCNAWRGSLGLEPTPELYVQHLVEIFREVKRVLRSDGTVWLNLGDSYHGSWGNAGHRPELDGTPSVQREKSTEWLSRKGWAERRDRPASSYKIEGLKPKDLVGIPWMTAFALRTDGWYLRSDVIWAKPNPMPESVQDRPTKSHEYLFLLAKSTDYFYDADAILEPSATEPHASGRKETEQYGEDLGNRKRLLGIGSDRVWAPSGKRNKRSVWTISTQPYKGAHFATFPRALIEPCILAGTSGKGCCSQCGAAYERVVESKSLKRDELPEDDPNYRPSVYKVKYAGPNVAQGFVEKKTLGWQPTCKCNAEVRPCVVFDPFLGSGTTAVVSETLGRDWIGIELNQKYVELAKQRLRSEAYRPLAPVTEMKELKTPHFTEEETEEQATFDQIADHE